MNYFGNVTASLFALELNLRLDNPKEKNVNGARVTQSSLIMVNTMPIIKYNVIYNQEIYVWMIQTNIRY